MDIIESFFTLLFLIDIFDVVNHAVLTWEFFQLHTHKYYVWEWTTQLWHLSPHISRTCVKLSNIVSEWYYAPHAGHGRVWGLRITMVPLFTQPHTIALPPNNEKSFTTYLSRMGWPIRLKSVIFKASVHKNITNATNYEPRDWIRHCSLWLIRPATRLFNNWTVLGLELDCQQLELLGLRLKQRPAIMADLVLQLTI